VGRANAAFAANFRISTERIPHALVMALARVKRACAQVNAELGLLDATTAAAIAQAAGELLAGEHADAFPLSVWQDRLGHPDQHEHNEVLANRASELLGGSRGKGRRVHPNDHVNLGQSTNDIFPTAMHVAAAGGLTTTWRGAAHAARNLHAQSLGLRRHRENRPHPSAGRHAADLGPRRCPAGSPSSSTPTRPSAPP